MVTYLEIYSEKKILFFLFLFRTAGLTQGTNCASFSIWPLFRIMDFYSICARRVFVTVHAAHIDVKPLVAGMF